MAVTKVVKKREYSELLLMFLLKARKPHVYRERFDITHSGQVGIQIDALDAAIARIEAKESALNSLSTSSTTPALPEGPLD